MHRQQGELMVVKSLKKHKGGYFKDLSGKVRE
jgi:hypothetical protein